MSGGVPFNIPQTDKRPPDSTVYEDAPQDAELESLRDLQRLLRQWALPKQAPKDDTQPEISTGVV
jgi:hypothetical protein